MRENFYIITGGPGAGKTTLLEDIPVFFDRGIPDALAYARLIGDISPATLADEYRCNDHVFILPPWEEIYTTDEQRKQTFEEAVDVFHRLKAEYMAYGYQVVEVSCAPARERALFVLDWIGMHRKHRSDCH